MIETLYSINGLQSAAAFAIAALIGFFVGVAIERAGLGSSRKVAAFYYFRDMTYFKVILTAIVVAAIGLGYLFQIGWLNPDSVRMLETVYGAQAVGGFLVGVGMVMAGRIPGTATVGLASGRIDAAIFLIAVLGGSIIFNEVFTLIQPLYNWHSAGVVRWPSLVGTSSPFVVLGLTVVAVILFWVCELIEHVRQGRLHQLPHYVGYLAGQATPPDTMGVGMPGRALIQTGYYRVSFIFLGLFSIALIGAAVGLLFVQPSKAAQFTEQGWRPFGAGVFQRHGEDQRLLESVEQGADHVSPGDLAQRLMSGERGLQVVDIRTPQEFQAFHIRGAVNAPPQDLPNYLKPYKNQGSIVLYANDMTHPAQAATLLRRQGYNNVYILTGGLEAFADQCLKPASLRPYPVTEEQAQIIRQCREYFLAEQPAPPPGKS
jgi:rhodanese-related sulfurtransferase